MSSSTSRKCESPAEDDQKHTPHLFDFSVPSLGPTTAATLSQDHIINLFHFTGPH